MNNQINNFIKKDTINKKPIDLTYLKFEAKSYSQNTYGCYLKSFEIVDDKKIYYKISNYDMYRLVFGYESFNEYIVSRLLDCLEIEHLKYYLVYAKVKVDNKKFNTYLNVSYDFKQKNERKEPFDSYYYNNRLTDESPIDFLIRNGFEYYLYNMLFVDYAIFNRDRHGANVEVLIDDKGNVRLSPLFDHGLSLLLSDYDDENYIKCYDIFKNEPTNSFFGTRSTYDNLKFIKNKNVIMRCELNKKDFDYMFSELYGILPEFTINKMKSFIQTRLNLWKDFL